MLTVTVVIFSLALGGLLAQRYSIMAIPAATLIVLMIVAGLELMSRTGLWSTITLAIVASISLQIGYFLGLACAQLLSPRVAQKLPVYPTSPQNSAR